MNADVKMNIKEKIDFFLELLPTLTQEESDMVDDILNWDDETKAAYRFAKQIFEDNERSDKCTVI